MKNSREFILNENECIVTAKIVSGGLSSYKRPCCFAVFSFWHAHLVPCVSGYSTKRFIVWNSIHAKYYRDACSWLLLPISHRLVFFNGYVCASACTRHAYAHPNHPSRLSWWFFNRHLHTKIEIKIKLYTFFRYRNF